MNWEKTTIGPGVYDLVRFVDQTAMLPGVGSANSDLLSETVEETIVDSYILAMRGGVTFELRLDCCSKYGYSSSQWKP